MNKAQRVVLLIGLGLGFVVIAVTANLVMADPVEPSLFRVGQTDDYFVIRTDRSIIEQAAVWVGGIALWVGAALWLLRDRPAPDEA